MLYITTLLIIYFIAASLYLLISLTYFTHPPTALPTSNHQFVLHIYESVSVCCVYSFIFEIPHISEIIQYLFIFIFWASLVAQWLRVCLPMQGTWV